MYNLHHIPDNKSELIRQLQQEVWSMQATKRPVAPEQRIHMGIGPIEDAFPGKVFPTGAVHEFISDCREDAAATSGFMIAILSQLLAKGGRCIWISSGRTLFAPILAHFGIVPEQVLFIDLRYKSDIFWSIEEALKCTAITTVVAELPDLNFKESRRLQLAVEQSGVTGFLHRYRPRVANTIACVARWQVMPLPSRVSGLPGIGTTRWSVALNKVRNGRPGSWEVCWDADGLHTIITPNIQLPAVYEAQKRMYG